MTSFPKDNLSEQHWLEDLAQDGADIVQFADLTESDRGDTYAHDLQQPAPDSFGTVIPLHDQPAGLVPDHGQQLVRIEGINSGLRHSRELFEGYISMREGVKLLDKDEGPELEAVQESVRVWLDGHKSYTHGQKYDSYDRDHVANKLLGLNDFLRANHPEHVNELELAATEAFVEATFAMYQDREEGDGVVSPDADGSFAFVVPARMSRKDKDYGKEVEPAIPALRYVPNELRAQMLVGVPPFIIDTYLPDSAGKRGYLVFAPIFSDMLEDIVMQGGGRSEIMQTARYNIDNAVDFAAERLGVSVVGLGATIPSMTNFGRAVKNDKVLVTTGHGGTAYLVKETARKAIAEGLVDNADYPKVGVIGLGAIGAPIARLAIEEFEPPVRIYDTDEAKRERTKRDIGADEHDVLIMDGEEELIRESDVIISAIVGRVHLSSFANRLNLKGKVIVDDSQPGSFDPREVEAYGGKVVWVIGRDTSTKDPIEREGYDYATMADEKRDLFGCEAEAATIYKYSQDLKARGMTERMIARMLESVSVREPVSPAKARRVGALFKKFGIEPSEMQAFGRRITRTEA